MVHATNTKNIKNSKSMAIKYGGELIMCSDDKQPCNWPMR